MPKSLLNHNILSSQRGISTLEMLIAFTVLILSLSTVVTITFGSQSLAVDSETNDYVLYKAQEQIENARAVGRKNFFSLESVDPFDEDFYRQELKVDWSDDYIKKITSEITWKTEELRPQSISLSTVVTTWENSFRGDTCDPEISGDWSDPQELGHADITSPSGATDIDTRINKVYLTSDPAATGHNDFYIFNVIDPNTIEELSGINTGPGLKAVHVAGDYAYVANTDINAQLQVIKISDPEHPVVVASYKIPGVTGTGDNALGNSIFYKNGRVYLGLTKTTSGPEFNIIDVSDLGHIQYLGGWQANTQINSIYIRDNLAFLATPEPSPSTPEKENLSILDITNPASIIRVNTYTAPNSATQDGQSFFFAGDTLYFGRKVGGVDNPDNHELFVFDISGAPTLNELGSKNISSTVNAMTLKGNYLFMLTSEPNLGLQIWDVQDPNNIYMIGSKNVEQTSTGGMDCEGKLIYLAQRSGHALQIIGPK